jgi:uridine nucleosidase
MRAAVHAPAIHGASGIDGTLLLPEPAHSFNPQNAIAAMYGAIMATAPQTCVLVATGTLTNVALLLSAFPDVAAHLKAVSIMGGAFGNPGGNITAHAEFNIFCDPESAQAVFSHPQLAGGRIFLVPLDATHTVLATEIVQNRLLVGGGGIDRIGGDVCETTGKGNEFRRMLYELLTYFAATYAKVFDITEGPPLHDPLAVAAALTGKHAVGFEWEEGIVKVVCDGVEAGKTLLTRGEDTYVRRASLGGEDGPYMGTVVMVAKKVDSNAFWKVMLEMVDKADGRFVWPKDFLKTD